MNMMYYEMSVTQLKDEAQKRKLLGYKSKLIKHQLIKLLIDSDTVHCVNVGLLLFSDGEKQHYCWAKNLSRLLARQRSKNGLKRVYCLRCFNHFQDLNMKSIVVIKKL